MPQAIHLQNTALSVIVLKIFTDDIQQVKYDLNERVEDNQDEFIGKAVVIEPKIELEDPTFIALLVEFLYQLEMMPVGIKTEDESMFLQAEYAGLAIISEEFSEKTSSQGTISEPVQEKETNQIALTVENVRSGQQIYAKNRDLIVLGSVNAGAEVISDGNVHIYGKIKGKVFAGASGLKTAKIFAYNFDPEMVVIAGLYQLSEDIENYYKQGFVEISLNEKEDYIQYRRMMCQP